MIVTMEVIGVNLGKEAAYINCEKQMANVNSNGNVNTNSSTDIESDSMQIVKEKEIDDEVSDIQCGFMECHPRNVQKCANIKAFTINMAILYVFQLAFFRYEI